MVAFCGLMVMDCKTAGPTVRMPNPDTEPTVAVMVELPTATAVAKPGLLTVATLPDEGSMSPECLRPGWRYR